MTTFSCYAEWDYPAINRPVSCIGNYKNTNTQYFYYNPPCRRYILMPPIAPHGVGIQLSYVDNYHSSQFSGGDYE